MLEGLISCDSTIPRFPSPFKRFLFLGIDRKGESVMISDP